MAALIAAVAMPAMAAFSAMGTDTRQILAEQREIRNEVDSPRGRYSRFNEAARTRLDKAQKRIFSLLEGGRTIEDMDKNEQVALLNAVEEVKAVLSQNRGDQLQCWREAKLGSGMKVTRCETVATRERLREEARAWKGDDRICIKEGGCRVETAEDLGVGR